MSAYFYEISKIFIVYSYVAAAEILAESKSPFEEIVLKFVTNESARNGLKKFVELKLNQLGTMVCVYIFSTHYSLKRIKHDETC